MTMILQPKGHKDKGDHDKFQPTWLLSSTKCTNLCGFLQPAMSRLELVLCVASTAWTRAGLSFVKDCDCLQSFPKDTNRNGGIVPVINQILTLSSK